FFLSLYSYHLYLHSFPTRRSSNLIYFSKYFVYHSKMKSIILLASIIVLAGCTENARARKFGATQTYRVEAKQKIVNVTWKEADLDRKSTRLNSSHGSISYAVFCLK